MTIPVDVARLGEALADYGDGYLLTVDDEQRVHAVGVTAVLLDGALLVGPTGRRTTANLTQRPDVAMIFPPREPTGYTLIVDGQAGVVDGQTRVVPEAAVLHRPGPPGEPAAGTGCVSDCVPLGSADSQR